MRFIITVAMLSAGALAAAASPRVLADALLLPAVYTAGVGAVSAAPLNRRSLTYWDEALAYAVLSVLLRMP